MHTNDLCRAKRLKTVVMENKNFFKNTVSFLIFIFLCQCISFAQPVDKKSKTFDWNQITISGPEAKLFPRVSVPFVKKLFIGINYDIGTMPANFGYNYKPKSKDIELAIDDELFNNLVEKLSGEFFIPDQAHTENKILQNWYSIKVEFFALPNLSILASEQITSGSTKVYFPLTVSESSSTGESTRTYPKDGSYQLRIVGFNTEIGCRYYQHTEKVSLYPEFSIGFYLHRGYIEDVKIRDVAIPFNTDSRSHNIKLGLGYGLRYRLMKDLFVEPQIQVFTLFGDTNGWSWKAGLGIWYGIK